MHGKWDNCLMASPQRARHARRRARRLPTHVSPTTLAIGGLAAVFALAGVLALRVMNVPAHLRQEGAAGPTADTTRHSAPAAHVRSTKTRAARSDRRADQRHTPTPTATPHPATPQRVAATTAPAPAPSSSSARPSPRPSPSSSSGGPLPLPTLTRSAAG